MVELRNLHLFIALSTIALFGIITFALAAATLATLNKRLDAFESKLPSSTSTTISSFSSQSTTATTTNTLNSVLAEIIRIEDIMNHLKQLQRIATANNGTRAVGTSGFNQTLNYIYDILIKNTNYNISKIFFRARQNILTNNPVLISSISGVNKTYIYSTNLLAAEFYQVYLPKIANFTSFIGLTAIPNVGCSDDDWRAASPSPAGRIVLVKRGICNFVDKAAFASKYNVTAILLYNDGVSPDRVPPIYINLGENNTLPALFLSYTVGHELDDAAKDPTTNVSVLINIPVGSDMPFQAGNMCADTLTGDPTQTIVIGSHSDSATTGPGINDNGSGSAANLELAIALARLFQTSTYEKYKYRVRFCWWGAEEIGLLGSDYHVKQAKISTDVGERLEDYLINLNYDMLGSPNYIFGVYDGRTANNNTPVQALPGSNKISSLYRDWFIRQNLPWDYTDFSGRSDYGPFLAEGVVAGGLFSGADETKTQEQRDRYDKILGQGMGGIAGVIQDPCYHSPFDSIQNINTFAYEKMVQAAGYVLEYLARQDDLKGWLYPNGRSSRSNVQSPTHKYNSINAYYRIPDL